MNEHRLSALQGSSPLGFLAALGALVATSRRPELGEVRLAWETEPPHAARLTAAVASPEALAQGLFDGLTDDSTPRVEAVTGTDKLKDLTVEAYRKRIEELTPDGAALLAALCSDATTDEKPRRGPLVMTGGPQDFVAEVRKLRAQVRAAGPAALRNALFGPWRYEDGHALGLDPVMERQHAYLAQKPVSDTTRRVPGAVLLAVAALEVLPLFPVASRRGFTNALFADRRWEALEWPLWSAPLTRAAVESLLLAGAWRHRPPREHEAWSASFVAVRNEVKTAGGSYPVLRPGRRSS